MSVYQNLDITNVVEFKFSYYRL